MSKFQKSLLIITIVICLLLISLGLVSQEDLIVYTSALLLATIIFIGGAVFLRRVSRPIITPKVIIISITSAYLGLVILVFIRPEIPINMGSLMIIIPIGAYLVLLRTHDIELGQGYLPTSLMISGGLFLLLLGWLFHRELLFSILSSLK